MNYEGMCGPVRAKRLYTTKGDHHQAPIRASASALTPPLQCSHGDFKTLTDEMFSEKSLERRWREEQAGERK